MLTDPLGWLVCFDLGSVERERCCRDLGERGVGEPDVWHGIRGIVRRVRHVVGLLALCRERFGSA